MDTRSCYSFLRSDPVYEKLRIGGILWLKDNINSKLFYEWNSLSSFDRTCFKNAFDHLFHDQLLISSNGKIRHFFHTYLKQNCPQSKHKFDKLYHHVVGESYRLMEKLPENVTKIVNKINRTLPYTSFYSDNDLSKVDRMDILVGTWFHDLEKDLVDYFSALGYYELSGHAQQLMTKDLARFEALYDFLYHVYDCNYGKFKLIAVEDDYEKNYRPSNAGTNINIFSFAIMRLFVGIWAFVV